MKNAVVRVFVPCVVGIVGLVACGQPGSQEANVPTPEATAPDVSGPETSGPETGGPDASGPETGGPDASAPPTTQAGAMVGSGVLKSQGRPIRNVSRVRLSSVGELSITQGATESLIVEAEDNLLPLLETIVTNGRLEIRVRPNTSLSTTKPIKFKLMIKSLAGIEVSGAGRVVAGALTVPTLDVKLSQAGKLQVSSLKSQALQADVIGVGSLGVAAGAVVAQTVTLSGNGRFDTCGVASDTAKVTVAGVGRAVLNVKNSLLVSKSDIGSVQYVGAAKLEQSGSGLGRVTKLTACPVR
jgi:Putative auto-transporter adhesin, head GIN domain